MYLLINLSEKDQIDLALFDREKIEQKTTSGRNRDLLLSIDNFLQEQGLKKEDLAGIMTVVGAGGFTSTRIGVVVANTLAFTLKIPVLAIQQSDIKKIQSLIPELLKQPVGQYAIAAYSGEPNITQKK